jgi:DNA-directed RNA polymerase beta' subunit
MFQVIPRNFSKEYDPERLVTNPDPIIPNTENFSNDGIFSELLFGKLSNGTEYSCKCGEYEGEFNLGHTCPKCKTQVQFMGLNLRREGWIDLIAPCFHPLLFRYVRKIIGKTTIQNIMAYKSKIHKNGDLIEPEFKHPYTGIGLLKLIENFDEIFDDFYNRKLKKEKEPSKRFSIQKDYTFINDHKDMLFIDKFPVVNVKLRPALLIGDTLDYHEMNNYYNGLIKNSNTLASLTDLELKNTNTVVGLITKNQELINILSDCMIKELNNKEGCIRNNILGSRLNFTSRAVITPLSGEYGIDDIVIPYLMGMELLKPVLLNKIKKLKNVSLFKANKLWFNATLKFDNLFYNIMCDIIKKDNIKLLLNRNPTIF